MHSTTHLLNFDEVQNTRSYFLEAQVPRYGRTRAGFRGCYPTLYQNVPRERLPIAAAARGRDNSCYTSPVHPLYLFRNGASTGSAGEGRVDVHRTPVPPPPHRDIFPCRNFHDKPPSPLPPFSIPIPVPPCLRASPCVPSSRLHCPLPDKHFLGSMRRPTRLIPPDPEQVGIFARFLSVGASHGSDTGARRFLISFVGTRAEFCPRLSSP